MFIKRSVLDAELQKIHTHYRYEIQKLLDQLTDVSIECKQLKVEYRRIFRENQVLKASNSQRGEAIMQLQDEVNNRETLYSEAISTLQKLTGE